MKAEEAIAGEIAVASSCSSRCRSLPIWKRVQRRNLAGFASHIYFPTPIWLCSREAAEGFWVLVEWGVLRCVRWPPTVSATSTVAYGPTYFAERALFGQISQHSTVEALPGSEWLRLYWQDWEAFVGVSAGGPAAAVGEADASGACRRRQPPDVGAG
ncbi:MAG UNVERIFIED_CONTAM: hypothetical protein LVQ98_03085 [Rickettsiaceae bacterium]